MEIISEFQGKYRFLSNFWPYPVWLEPDLIEYPTREHAYVARKTLDMELRKYIATIKTPGEVKKFGRKMKIRPDWTKEVKLVSMANIVWACLKQNAEFQEKLLATGDAELIEGNYWNDQFWGRCNGEGQNYLGRILMNCRKILKREREESK